MSVLINSKISLLSSVHLVTCRKDDLEVGLVLFSQAKKDGISPNLLMSRCILGKF